MIKSLIVPLLFATLVVGIAGHGDDMKKVGRLAFRSIIYFEIVTTLALAVGLIAVNFVKPGVGVDLGAASTKEGAEFAATHTTLTGVIEHTVPHELLRGRGEERSAADRLLRDHLRRRAVEGAGAEQDVHAQRLREPVGGDVQVREHRDGVRADRHRRGDRRHGVEGRARAFCGTSAFSWGRCTAR